MRVIQYNIRWQGHTPIEEDSRGTNGLEWNIPEMVKNFEAAPIDDRENPLRDVRNPFRQGVKRKGPRINI